MSDATMLRAFKPVSVNSTVNVAVTASNQVLALGTGKGVGTRAVRVVNSGNQTIFIDFGISTTTASLTTSLPMFANTVEVFTIQNDITSVAVIAGSTGSTMYLTIGDGM